MWTCTTDHLADGRSLRITPLRDGSPVPYAEVINGWRTDAEFRSAFNRWLADAPLPGYRWETPPATAATVGLPFEFVLMHAPDLAARADQRPFDAQFRADCTRQAVAFRNLGGDAILVVPCPIGPPDTYAHLATFVRLAPPDQQHVFWQTVGAAVRDRLDDRPLWLSTAGMAVAWLHVRLDDRPKYYGHAPYRTPPGV